MLTKIERRKRQICQGDSQIKGYIILHRVLGEEGKWKLTLSGEDGAITSDPNHPSLICFKYGIRTIHEGIIEYVYDEYYNGFTIFKSLETASAIAQAYQGFGDDQILQCVVHECSLKQGTAYWEGMAKANGNWLGECPYLRMGCDWSCYLSAYAELDEIVYEPQQLPYGPSWVLPKYRDMCETSEYNIGFIIGEEKDGRLHEALSNVDITSAIDGHYDAVDKAIYLKPQTIGTAYQCDLYLPINPLPIMFANVWEAIQFRDEILHCPHLKIYVGLMKKGDGAYRIGEDLNYKRALVNGFSIISLAFHQSLDGLPSYITDGSLWPLLEWGQANNRSLIKNK